MTEPIRRRRQRRSREDVLCLIRDAALQLFAERGYAGATTQEIARKADVSETLLFRHFGGKANLYDAVVSAPFLKIMESFGEEQQAARAQGIEAPDTRKQIGELFDFFEAEPRGVQRAHAGLCRRRRQGAGAAGGPRSHLRAGCK